MAAGKPNLESKDHRFMSNFEIVIYEGDVCKGDPFFFIETLSFVAVTEETEFGFALKYASSK